MQNWVDLQQPDLATDPQAGLAVKDEVVEVEFAARDGALVSAVGTNVYRAGDAVLTGSTGDRWSVSRERFDAKYLPEGTTRTGQAGRYRNRPSPVRARRMTTPFRVARSVGGDVLRGSAGDWLVQYAPGDYGIVAQDRFDRVYRLL